MNLRRLLIIIMVAALLVVYYLYGSDYLKRRQDNSALVTQISSVTEELAQVPPTPTDLEQRQAAASAELAAEINSFPSQLNNTQIVNNIMKLAESAGVKAVPLITEPWTTESVNQIDYPIFRLNVTATGTYERLSDFIQRLENGEPETTMIADLAVTWETNVAPIEIESGDAATLVAVINIVIYGQPSFADEAVKVDDQ